MYPANRTRCPKVLDDPYLVDVRLADLGMTRAWVWNAVEKGAGAHAFAPQHGFYGNGQYRAADQAIHELSTNPLDAGWHRSDYFGIPVAMNRDENIAVGVTTGDDNTGWVTDDDPQTTTVKGPATARAVNRLDFSVSENETYGVEYWILLGFWAGSETRCELSLPRIGDDAGHLVGWVERIIVPPISTDPRRRRAVPAAPAAPVTVPMVRRRRDAA